MKEFERKAIVSALAECIRQGQTSPRPVPPVLQDWIEKEDDWSLSCKSFSEDNLRNELVLDCKEMTATLHSQEYGEVSGSYEESEDGYRPAGTYRYKAWHRIDSIDVTKQHQAELKKFRAVWEEDQLRLKGVKAWNQEVEDLNRCFESEYRTSIKKFETVHSIWGKESVNNWLIAGDAEEKNGEILMTQGNPQYDCCRCELDNYQLEWLVKKFA